MDKTTKINHPHNMWNLSRRITDLIAVIGTIKEFEFQIQEEMFDKLSSMSLELYELSKDFKSSCYGIKDTSVIDG